jgi:hypothetical protein
MDSPRPPEQPLTQRQLRAALWGRDRAVSDRNAADNHAQPQQLSVQLSTPPRPSTAGHSYPPIRSDTEQAMSLDFEV